MSRELRESKNVNYKQLHCVGMSSPNVTEDVFSLEKEMTPVKSRRLQKVEEIESEVDSNDSGESSEEDEELQRLKTELAKVKRKKKEQKSQEKKEKIRKEIEKEKKELKKKTEKQKGNFFEKRATIVSASIPKYVSGIDGCTTQAFPGATIGRLTELISSGKVDLISLDFVIVHVGTNNISSSQSVDTIISYFGDLIHKLKKMTFAKLIFTSILPRPVDHMKTGAKVNKVNTELKRLCKRNNLLYCNLYRSFLLDNIPDASLFAPRDGLHLNFAGTELFRKKIINIIKHQSI
ncbi:uncharacterized protein LOC134709963 isoform X1 [Mytilus trossulus]|uniref:uncharacterized protein LOC134709963 isoform X1 n=1 Tax=Mytilus trossulus TaxID=6551 RepID=UPI003005AD4A